MRNGIVVAFFVSALIAGCGKDESTAPPTCVAPDQEITTYLGKTVSG